MPVNPDPSWNLLWDKQYAGRMATIDAVHDTPVVAALLAGVNPFDMTTTEMDKVALKSCASSGRCSATTRPT